MDHEHQDIEEALRRIEPAGLDDRLLERLADAVDGKLGVLGEEDRALEASLARLRPGAIPEAIEADFLRRTQALSFPHDEKVVPFQRTGAGVAESDQEPAETATRGRRRAWPAVAAALVAGVFTALMVPGAKQASPGPSATAGAVGSGGGQVMRQDAVGSVPDGLVPAGMGTDLNEARDLGVVWSADQRPMRVFRVTYKDRVLLRDENGKEAVVEVPRVEHILTPAEIE